MSPVLCQPKHCLKIQIVIVSKITHLKYSIFDMSNINNNSNFNFRIPAPDKRLFKSQSLFILFAF